MRNSHRIAGIGEVLWDIFPDGCRLGGAPVNFASHCHQLGCEAYPVSAVGNDAIGRQIREELAALGVSDRYILTNEELPTGRVLVSVDILGAPAYQIIEDVAWDELPFVPALRDLARTLDAACFGVLAQRSAQTRRTLRRFLAEMPETALKVCDVNLREPFYSKDLVEGALLQANVLKLSDEELPVLAEYFELAGSVERQLGSLCERFELTHVVFTRGGEGSLILSGQSVDECAGVPVEPVDTVGAGDSFTAAFTYGILNEWPLHEVNQFANRVASFVCSQKGATPRIPDELIPKLEQKGTISR